MTPPADVPGPSSSGIHSGTPPLFFHEDALALLDSPASLGTKLEAIHGDIAREMDVIQRVAVAVYDPATDLLKTLLASSAPDCALVHYDAKLSDSPSLREILRVGRPRVANDLEIFRGGAHVHTHVLREAGFRSSYTVPMFHEGTFWGFVFFNSTEAGAFTPERLARLDVYAHLIAALVTAEILAIRVLAAAVRTAHDMVHLRDPETGAHIDRMARYSRLIARDLAAGGIHRFDDRTIERIFEFAPLHDLGKVGIPDRILLKPSRLTEEERRIMNTHTTLGLAMVDHIARNFGLEKIEGLDLLRHIAESHHEALDGSGYPRGLKGTEIPLEARVVAVADVFDALTSERPYKPAWTNEDALDFMRKAARPKFDQDCVEALRRNLPEVREIQAKFRDERPTS